LEQHEVQVVVADAQHTKNLPRRKSDVQERQWLIKLHTGSVNLFAPTSLGDPVLLRLESFLHVRWEPVFEGKGGVCSLLS